MLEMNRNEKQRKKQKIKPIKNEKAKKNCQ